MLQRAEKQLKCFVDYLALSGWDQGKGEELTRDELLNQGHSLPTVTALVKRGLLETYEREVGRLNSVGEPHPENIKPLSGPQLDAYNQINFSFLKKNVTLLHGVTSSGKTEIYIHLIQQALEQKKQVLYLLPEIALTVQMMDRLRHVFGNRLGIYHSKYSDAERVEMWQKQLSLNPYDVILGARSAVFLPFQRLGLVIIDEDTRLLISSKTPCLAIMPALRLSCWLRCLAPRRFWEQQRLP
jgi:primosomal protein N' (replication factor Y)